MIKKKGDEYFLLTRSGYDHSGYFIITLFGVSSGGEAVKIIIDNFRPLFFIPSNTALEITHSAAERRSLDMFTFDKQKVDCLYFNTNDAANSSMNYLRSCGVKVYESDIYPVERYLMERGVNGGFLVEGEKKFINGIATYRNPKIRGNNLYIRPSVMAIDIETNGYTNDLYSISCAGESEICFMIGDAKSTVRIKYIKDEKELLISFFNHVQKEDPDIITGWNVINFDFTILQQKSEKYQIHFLPGRDGTASRVIQNNFTKKTSVKIDGRVVIDGLSMLRYNSFKFDSFSLGFVANKLLGETKLIEKTGKEKIDEINNEFINNKEKLAEYNIKDSILVRRILEKTRVIENAVEYSKLSGRDLDNQGGSIASFDHLYLPKLHRKGFVAYDRKDVEKTNESLPGGFVIEPDAGIYENVLLLDFKSLYPTIIMTFLIDPLGRIYDDPHFVKGPVGPAFSKKKSILPKIISELFTARGEAKKSGNAPLSYSIKILMNSFYGVMGSSDCRFFAPELATTITQTGRYILKKTMEYIEKSTGYTVIYGDTDSLFVHIGNYNIKNPKVIGNNICVEVTNWLKDFLYKNFKVSSKLELEFEMAYKHFFMPTIRHGTAGSKKRYCGTEYIDGKLKLIFKGLESARTDWTVASQDFQKELYKKVFLKESVEEFVLKSVDDIRAGRMDSKLVYKKHIRKPLSEYTVHIPPHVKAARKLDREVKEIRYVITTDGPVPVEINRSKLDYEHYVETQIKPIADSILSFVNLDFDTLISGQQDLFN